MNSLRHKILYLTIIAAVLVSGFFIFANLAQAQVGTVADPNSELNVGLQTIEKPLGLPATDIRVVVANIIRVALGLLGIVVLALMLYAGYLWMTAGGNEEKITEAKKILRNAVVGLVIIMSAYAIVSFVMRRFVEATTGLPAHCTDGVMNKGEGPQADCGGECGACPLPPCQGPSCYNALFIESLPPSGDVCIRNVHPVIVFNRAVDIATIPGNIIINKKSDGSVAGGSWSYLQTGGTVHQDTIVFTPNGACPDDGTSDCFDASTEYRLTIPATTRRNIVSLTGGLSLSCGIRAGCNDVPFKTGEGVDRSAPTVEITAIDPNEAGKNIWVNVHFTDDNGVQTLLLDADGNRITSRVLTGCQKSGDVPMLWPTQGLAPGIHPLVATALDYAAWSDTDNYDAVLRAAHCFNGILDRPLENRNPLLPTDELGVGVPPAPDCGGTECGACAGAACDVDADCASGYCDPATKTCVDRMRITRVSPISGAPDTFVSIAGLYFGTTTGRVYFANKINPNSSDSGDWIEAPLAPCSGAKTWLPWQLIVTVPNGAVDGPIKVETASSTGPDGVERKFIDATHDDWGVKATFDVNDLVRPGLCRVYPDAGPSGLDTLLSGKNFGNTIDSANDKVMFGELRDSADSQDRKALVSPVENWGSQLIAASVPTLDSGWVGTAVFNNDVQSNVLAFRILAGADEDSPVITNITPDHGARGQYITISGRNFGRNQGYIWLKEEGDSHSDAINTDEDVFAFPDECGSTWSDDQIVIKFPTEKGIIGKWYSVQVVNVGNGKNSIIDRNIGFTLGGGQPTPGICRMDPETGPAPLASTGTMRIIGEYFATSSGAKDYSDSYYWQPAASSTSVVNRLPAARDDYFVLGTSGPASLMHVRIPSGTISGPVVVKRDADTQNIISNPVKYTKWNCVENKGVCTDPDTHCCTAGGDAGVCKSNTELCEGEKRSSGYVWMFCTKDIPEPPRVVERCDSETDLGHNLPSPSPSVQWGRAGYYNEHQRACLTSLITVDFVGMGDVDTVPGSGVVVRECDSASIDLGARTCLRASGTSDVPLRDWHLTNNGPYKLDVSQVFRGQAAKYVQLQPQDTYNGNGKWKKDTWYQVVLNKDIVGGVSSTALLVERACDNSEVSNSAYCFLFKSGSEDCMMKELVITPFSYWTTYLEAPLMQHNGADKYDLYYSGHGLSDQYCIMMDVKGFKWEWNVQNPSYADIHGARTRQDYIQIDSKQNTVGVNLPGDATAVLATASTGTVSYTNSSSLMIDLSDPEVIEYWPNCLEACTNAEIGARWNVTMSALNLGKDFAVQLRECQDENCLQLSGDNFAQGAQLDSYGTVMTIKLRPGMLRLDPNTLYQVILSTTTGNISDPNLIWSRQIWSEPLSAAHPYKKTFRWRFKTKKQDCLIDHTQIIPSSYTARKIGEKSIFQTQPFSAPDACSAVGQRLDAWSVGWAWGSTDSRVATIYATSTRGQNAFCNNNCLKRGSEVPAGYAPANMALCGNGVVEAGEDCDLGISGESAQSCTLDCLRPGNSNVGNGGMQCGNGVVDWQNGEECDPASTDPKISIGCNNICLRAGSKRSTGADEVGASICGNGRIGAGEDCDLGIAASASVSTSSLACSETCLHLGSRISAAWCYVHRDDWAGFASNTFWAACNNARSQCGDKMVSPDEDAVCENSTYGWVSSTCNIYCLVNKSTVPATSTLASANCVFTDYPNNTQPSEGCNKNLQHAGSSLLYSKPSTCGDGVVGLGEDPFCETSLVSNNRFGRIDPVAMATAVGLSPYVSAGTPPTQLTFVGATTTEGTFSSLPVGNNAKYSIPCGYNSDAECQAATNDPHYAVAANTCCYPRPRWLSSYPANAAIGVCPNTYIEASFDQTIDQFSARENFVIAQGITDPSFGVTELFDYHLPRPKSVYAAMARSPKQMAVSGKYAYVIYEEQDLLEIINISDPDNLRRVSSIKNGDGGARLDRPVGIGVSGNYAYILSRNDNGIEVVDISNPENPVHKYFHTTADASGAFVDPSAMAAVSGANGSINLYAISRVAAITNPKSFVSCYVAAGQTPENISCAKKNPGADYDLSNSDTLFAQRVGTGIMVWVTLANNNTALYWFVLGGTTFQNLVPNKINPGIYVSSVRVGGNGVYVSGVNSSDKLMVKSYDFNRVYKSYNISNGINSASFVDYYPIPNSITGQGFVLAASDVGNSLVVLKSDNNSLSYLGTVNNSDDSNLVGPVISTVIGNNLFIGSNQRSTIESYDLSGLKGLPNIGTTVAFNNSLYVASGLLNGDGTRGAMQQLNLSDYTHPINLGEFNIGATMYKAVVTDDLIFGLSNKSNGTLHVVDMFLPDRPRTSTLSDNPAASIWLQNPVALAAKNNYVYILSLNDEGSLQIVDTNTTTAPAAVGRIKYDAATGIYLQQPRDIKINGDLAYVLSNYNNGTLQIFDISTATNPVAVGVINKSIQTDVYLQGAKALVVKDDLAYVAATIDNALTVIDISSSTNLRQIGRARHTSMTKPSQVLVEGRYAYVGGVNLANYPAIYIIDVSSSTSPVLVTSTVVRKSNSGDEIQSMSIVGGYLYVTLVNGVNLSSHIAIVDINKFLVQGDCYGTNDVTGLITGVYGSGGYDNLPWYKKVWSRLAGFVRKVLVGEVTAADSVRKWCVDKSLGVAQVIPDNVGEGSRILYRLSSALSPDTHYAVVIKEKLRDIRGVAVGYATTTPLRNYNFTFTTRPKVCAVNSLTVTPTLWAFQNLNSSTHFQAEVFADNGQQIQPVDKYFWDYIWGPMENEYVTLTPTSSDFNTTTPKNKNGETDIAATANIKRNDFSDTLGLAASGQAHIVVFLCNNPWPANDYRTGQFRIPYQDAIGNNDGFSLSLNLFDGNPIPAATGVNLTTSSDGGYFNFSSYYCMDSSGSSAGNLPFLRPAVQSNASMFDSNNGVCSLTGSYCDDTVSVLSQCKAQFTIQNNTYFASSTQNICYGKKSGTTTYFIGLNNSPLFCSDRNTCSNDAGFARWKQAGEYTDYGCDIPTNKVLPTCIVRAQPIKRFLFTNQKNNDVIGIQVFPNPKVLSVEQWFNNDKTLGGQGFSGRMQTLTLDGFRAVRDNNNIYVDVFNVSSDNDVYNKKFFSNIILFSINADAQSETRQVFEQMLGNLRFNTNLTNYGYCENNVEQFGASTTCKTDFDCPRGQVCANQKIKVQRNYQRLRDLKDISVVLGQYFNANNRYPSLSSGSYLPGQTLSTWPAWTAFSNAVNYALNPDPINKMPIVGTCSVTRGKICTGDSSLNDDVVCPTGEHCIIHEPNTGWSTVDRRFSFACHPSSSVYRYMFNTSTAGFEVRAHLEEPFATLGPLRGFSYWSLFKQNYFGSDWSKFIIDGANGACITGEEISTVTQGSCGDGQVNLGKGEQCDPPGAKQYNTDACATGGANASVKTCQSNCTWSSAANIPCSGLVRTCGNGVLEPGEACDQGRFNGTYNHCNSACTGFENNTNGRCGDAIAQEKNEICDIMKPRTSGGLGICSDGTKKGEYCANDAECQSTVNNGVGVCKTPNVVGVRYGKTKTESCNFDCQSRGPYCGDGIVQPEFGEECDGNQSCTTWDGNPGRRYCLPNCKQKITLPANLAAWWQLDDAKPLAGTAPDYTKYKFYSTKVNPDGSTVLDDTNNNIYAISEINNNVIDFDNHASVVISPKLPIRKPGYLGSGYDATNYSYEFGSETFASTTLEIDQSENGNDGRSLTYMAWVYPTGLENIRRQVFSADLGGFGWSLLSSNEGAPAGFNTWQFFNNGDGRINTGMKVDVGYWQHIAVVYDRQQGKVFFYKNGGADPNSSTAFSGSISYRPYTNSSGYRYNTTKQYLHLGINADRRWWYERMSGRFDEMMVFNRAVTQSEIEQYVRDGAWKCEPLTPPTSTPTPSKCGNGVVESNEACDSVVSGVNKNGIACTPEYGKTCSYCSADCKNRIDVQPTEYCGDGKLQSGKEQCDGDIGSCIATSSINGINNVPKLQVCNNNCRVAREIAPNAFGRYFFNSETDNPVNVNIGDSGSTEMTVAGWFRFAPDSQSGGLVLERNIGSDKYIKIYFDVSPSNKLQVKVQTCGDTGSYSGCDMTLPGIFGAEPLKPSDWNFIALRFKAPLDFVYTLNTNDPIEQVSYSVMAKLVTGQDSNLIQGKPPLLVRLSPYKINGSGSMEFLDYDSGALAGATGRWKISGANADEFHGQIRNLMVWNSLQTDEELQNLYRAGLADCGNPPPTMPPAPRCQPTCSGRSCGADGCGGSCGSCSVANTTCSPAGNCVCEPETPAEFCTTHNSPCNGLTALNRCSQQMTVASCAAPCNNSVVGNNTIEGGEECDDGNTISGDGCSSSGKIESGYECPPVAGSCRKKCGNGATDPGEICDIKSGCGGGTASVCSALGGWLSTHSSWNIYGNGLGWRCDVMSDNCQRCNTTCSGTDATCSTDDDGVTFNCVNN